MAHRAVERVVHEEELEHAVLGLGGDLGGGVDLHLRRALDHAARQQGRAPTGVDLDDAHAAHAHRVHARVVAEARDVDAVALGRVDDQLALVGPHRRAVDGDRDAGLRLGRGGLEVGVDGGVRHRPPPGA
jgi:hypothetical protein